MIHLNNSNIMKTTDGNSIKNQQIKGEFIGKHVYCNVNSMVDYILKQSFEDTDAPFNMDDIENYYTYPEWSTFVIGEELYFEGGNDEDKEEFLENFDRLIEESEELLNSGKISEETHERNCELVQEAKEGFEEATEESEVQEVYEWYVVSSFLLEKLKALGHPVIEHENLWGRCTTGQAVLLDYAITQVCSDMEILEGQKNSWA